MKQADTLFKKAEVLIGNGLIKRIHINQHAIKRNRKTGDREPVITVKTYKSNDYGHEVIINGPCKVIYAPDKPLSCGAHVWIETKSEVEVVSEIDRSDRNRVCRNCRS